MAKLDYTSKEELTDFAKRLKSLPHKTKIDLCVLVHKYKLMDLPFILRVIGWFVGEDKIMATFSAALFKNEKLTDETWDGVVDHIANGKDKTDPLSAGGWNETEVDLFIVIMDVVLQSDPVYTELRSEALDELQETGEMKNFEAKTEAGALAIEDKTNEPDLDLKITRV